MKGYHYYFLIPRNSNSQVTLQDAKQINDCLENMVSYFYLNNKWKSKQRSTSTSIRNAIHILETSGNKVSRK